MIWGSVWSSSSAWPSAIRSGQNATSTLLAAVRERRRHVLGRARVDGAAQDDQRAVAEVGRDLVDGPLEHAHRRAEELVDGRADDEEHGVGAADDLGVGAELEAARREHLAEQLVRAVLHERHLAPPDLLERRAVDVVDADPQAGVREREAERQARRGRRRRGRRCPAAPGSPHARRWPCGPVSSIQPHLSGDHNRGDRASRVVRRYQRGGVVTASRERGATPSASS